MDYQVILGVVILIAIYLIWNRTRKKPLDIDIPMPDQLRNDLLFGYYSSNLGQLAETRDHINLFWINQVTPVDYFITDILDGRMFTVIDVSAQVFDPWSSSTKRVVKADAPFALRTLFNKMQEFGALKYIKMIVPIDEPNVNVQSEEDLSVAIDIIKRISSDFPELYGVKLGVIYAPTAPYYCLSKFDWVGINDYPEKSSIFDKGGLYDNLISQLSPSQQLMVIPGGSFGQDPQPFLAYAESNPRVAAIVAFLWYTEGDITGIGSLPYVSRDAYVRVGQLITGKTST